MSKFCFTCEEEISPKRLKALPNSALCIRCQEGNDIPIPRERPIDMRRMAYVEYGPNGINGSMTALWRTHGKTDKQPCEGLVENTRGTMRTGPANEQ